MRTVSMTLINCIQKMPKKQPVLHTKLYFIAYISLNLPMFLFQHLLQLIHKRIDVLKLPVDRGKTHIRHGIQVL